MPKILDEAKELRKLWGGFWSSRVLLTANNYRIFDLLVNPRSAGEISKTLKVDGRAAEILLDALTGLGLLKKGAGRYRNMPRANRFLVQGGPYYQGDIIRHADILWKNWSGLDEVVKTGKPHHVAHDQGSFIRGMHNLASFKAKDVITLISMKGVKRALDLGGGPGTYSIEMAKKGVSVVLFDRPETVEIAKDMVGKSKVGKIDFIRGDFVTDDIGRGYDLIFISQALHSCSVDECMDLVKRCLQALNPKGRIVVQEFYLGRDRAHPTQSALFSVNMLVNTPAGRCYSPFEIKGWLSYAGFKRIKERVRDDNVLIFGGKP